METISSPPVTPVSGPARNSEPVPEWPGAVLDSRQLAEAEQMSIADGISEIESMARAGRAVASEIQRNWSPRPTVVLCGPGKNGGDGFATAIELAAAGWPVRVALVGDRHLLAGAALHHCEIWAREIEPLAPAVLDGAELVVDALYGGGFCRPLEEMARETLAAAAQRRLPIVAIDLPSGLVGDSGECLGAVQSKLTVTFFRKKPAHLLFPGRALCGRTVVIDTGTNPKVLQQLIPNTFENHPALWLEHLPRPHYGDCKYTRGHTLVSGGYPHTGPSRLAARAAARVGSGIVTVAVPSVAFPIYATALTSILVHPLVEPEEFHTLLLDPRITAILVGPGATPGPETREWALSALATKLPAVLDAGALTAFREAPKALDRAIAGPCVLTPHEEEFQRLFGAEGSKLERTRMAARRSVAVVILKGCDTVIAAPDGRTIINTNAPPCLASAGSGDVLSGLIAGLLAQGMEPFLAAAAAVWLHGAAAAAFGPGLLAEDLPDSIPGVLAGLLDHE